MSHFPQFLFNFCRIQGRKKGNQDFTLIHIPIDILKELNENEKYSFDKL